MWVLYYALLVYFIFKMLELPAQLNAELVAGELENFMWKKN